MRVFIMVASLCLAASYSSLAKANCVGTSQFETCQDQNGNDYTVNRIGGQTFVNGRNEQTGNSWNEHSNTVGNQTFIDGTAANGRSWNETETRLGPNNTMVNGMDANGNSFSRSCNQFGCN